MGRKKGSYQFEKRQKELRKQKKKMEKLQRRQNKGDVDDEPQPSFDIEGFVGTSVDDDSEDDPEA